MRRLFTLVWIGLAFGGPAAAQSLADYDYEYLGLRGIGFDAGYIWADKVDDTEQYSVRIDLGYLGPGIRIIPSISYWSSALTAEELDDLAGRLSERLDVSVDGQDLAPLEWSDLSVSVDGQLVWNTPVDVLTYVGIGLGLHALNGRGDVIDDTFIEDLLDTITAGASTFAGLELELLSGVHAYGEGRYTLMNSIHYLTARVGLQLMFRSTPPGQVGAVPAPPIHGSGR